MGSFGASLVRSGWVAVLGVATFTYVLRPVRATEPKRSLPSVSSAAYDSVLRARYLSVRTTDVDTQAAIALLERAVALDPRYAVAYAELAAAYVTRLTFVTPRRPRIWSRGRSRLLRRR